MSFNNLSGKENFTCPQKKEKKEKEVLPES